MALISPCALQSWNRIIKHQVFEGKPERALLTYIQMQELGEYADNYTYPILLKAVSALSISKVGFALHGQAIKTGFCHHSFVQTAFLNVYSHFGYRDDARRMFEQIPEKDLVVYNSMLDSYASVGDMENASILFDSMPCKDLLSYNIMVSGYARRGEMAMAHKVFDESPERDIFSWNSMILACCNAGDVRRARNFFEQMKERNVVTWNTMLTGYLANKCFDSAISLFEEMMEKNYDPDYLTVSIVLSAITSLGCLGKGQKLHVLAMEKGLASSPNVTTALIDMYAKCGKLQSSLEVFYKSQIKDIFCWNAILSGLALHGHAFAAFKLFDEMKSREVTPDDITFIALLSACNHMGLVQKGIELFHRMEKEFHIYPKSEHYSCIVDLLGRAGFLVDAFQFIKSIQFEPGKTILGALLGACVNHRDVEIGEEVLKLIVKRADDKLSDGEYMMILGVHF
ncbi:hypothetical protein M9H77_18988 [Catharanthus roseus]|uniref:Uncharacterized protein n=1 Tax=Catharanthus roseus TaxID=4058 RepID=A0ACC0B909_CATRO|nr:hypothetical protein M9H77_18988 [Catharanthus roseus]